VTHRNTPVSASTYGYAFEHVSGGLGVDECVGGPSLCEAYFFGDSLKGSGHEGEMHEAFA
jgi:hypothetical protein